MQYCRGPCSFQVIHKIHLNPDTFPILMLSLATTLLTLPDRIFRIVEVDLEVRRMEIVLLDLSPIYGTKQNGY